mgnify:CR=1 FL=1
MKSFKLLSIILMLITVMFVLAGCGKSGSRLTNLAPEISITSFEGWDSTYVDNGYATDLVYSFYQRIYWHAWDKDGTIAGYAFRVLDANGDPITTLGYEYIADPADGLTPQNLLDLDPKAGWVIHYVPGEDQSKPLDDPGTRRTIWTSQKYAVINFPSADANGNPIQRASRFEVIAIDNRGAICSNTAWRNFTTTSVRPTCTISTTKGDPNGGIVGAGLKLSFTMDDKDPFIPVIPYKYEFMMMKTDLAGNVITPPESLVWVDTKTQLTEPGVQINIAQFLLNLSSNPPITYDYDSNGVATTITRVTARATDMAGVVSVPDSHTVINFKVKRGFSPKSLVYGPKTYAMGDYHFDDWGDDSTPEVLPTQFTQGGQRWATPFFKDLEGKNTAIYSNNMRVWLRWGWFGEYGSSTESGTITYDENVPYGKKVDVVLDRYTGENYFSEITHFHIRYDGDYYKFPPYEHLKVQDDDGDWWLRVPVNSVIGQSILLTGLPAPTLDEPGIHVFEIACEDLQGVVDPEPAVFEFILHALRPASQRSGILVIDDDINHPAHSPHATVKAIYEDMFSDYTGNIRYVFQTSNGEEEAPIADARGRKVALSDMLKYKLVVYHNDNPNNDGGFVNLADALTIYMLNGGNLMVSNSSRLKPSLESLSPTGRRSTLIKLMGFTEIPSITILGSSVTNNPFFIKAKSDISNLPDIALNTTTSFNSVVNSRKGLGAVAIMSTTLPNVTTVYKLGSKAVGADNFSPTSAQFEQYNDQPVGIRYTTPTGGKAFTYGFPLSYMVTDDARAMINSVVTELGL